MKGTLSVVYLMTFGSIIGFTAYVWLLHHVRPTLAGSYAYVNPVIAVMLGAWLAAERFTAHDLGAMVVILFGVVAITLGKARAPKAGSGRIADMTHGARSTAAACGSAAGSFVIWGLMPLYWHLLKTVPSMQIVMHRIVWSALLVVGWLCLTQGLQLAARWPWRGRAWPGCWRSAAC